MPNSTTTSKTEALRPNGWSLNPKFYIFYKLFNSLFLGLSVGTVFTIYKALDPSIYSIGGILLAIAMLIIAQLYGYIMTLPWFFTISLFVELVVFVMVSYFLIKPYTWSTAIFVYIGYQITFSFGSYLVRAETLALDSDELLKRVDTAKQLGYLIGMALSWGFYKLLEYFSITKAETKVYDIHWLLLIVEIVIIYLLIKSFTKKKESL